MGNRKAAEEYILKYIGKLVKGKENVELYANLFKSMNDKEFNRFMERLRDGEITLSIVVPTGRENMLSIENSLKVGEEIGAKFFQKLKVTNHPTLPDHYTPHEYLVVDIPVRRASQTLDKKISVSEDARIKDSYTGQVTGKSKASQITLPEIQVLLGLGLNESVIELLKVRGGDLGAAHAADTIIYKKGNVSMEELKPYNTGVESTKTLKSLFNAMHIISTL